MVLAGRIRLSSASTVRTATTVTGLGRAVSAATGFRRAAAAVNRRRADDRVI